MAGYWHCCGFVVCLLLGSVQGVDIGALPNLAHGVSGTLEILTTTRLRIRDFSYDGLGPLTFLYYYPPGVPVNSGSGQGIKIPLPSPAGDSTGALTRGRAYDNEDLTFDLPTGVDACDISTLTIWCERFPSFFTRLMIPTSVFAEDGADPCRLAGTPPPTTTIPPPPPPIIVGDLPTLRHGVSGTLEIISTTTLRITEFSYDGLGPGSVLYYYPPGVPVDPVRNTSQGIQIPLPPPEGDATGGFVEGRVYTREVLTFDLPDGMDVCDISTFTIWCADFDVFFTQLLIPTSTFVEGGADPCRIAPQEAPPPQPASLGTLPTLDHGVSGTLEIISTTTLRITEFSYDGQGPGAFLYYYPHGVPVDPVKNTSQGIKIPVPPPEGDASGALVLGRAYNREVLTFDLPPGMDVCDISTFTIWCADFDVFFTQLLVLTSNFVDDGADPCRVVAQLPTPPVPAHQNCVPLDNSLQLFWTVNEGNARVDFTICGCQSSNPSITQYMGFGLSGSNSRTFMEGADVTISWMDDSDGPSALDYHLRRGNRVQCRSGLGVCPDTLDDRGTCSNNVLSVSGYTTNRQQCVRFSRPFATDDTDCDLPMDPSNTQQYIVWGIGPLEETAFMHFSRSGASTPPIHLGREPLDECRNAQLTCESCPPFDAVISRPRDGLVYQARIGPSGSDRGYMALTGQAGWGIAWYINDILAPELYVIRGETYTFIVEGGDDASVPSSYHPFYITDSISGGRLRNTPQQQETETVFAGFDEAGRETGTGRLCTLMETADATRIRERCGPVDMYISSLSTTCDGGSAGTVRWTPDGDTPDVVYYQCATHRNLGWRINVVNDASEIPTDMPVSSSPPLLALSLSTIAVMLLASLLLSQ